MDLLQGQRVKLADIGANVAGTTLELSIQAPGVTLDFSCFGIDAAGKLSDDRYMTFFNQPTTPCGGVAVQAGTQASTKFVFNFSKLPASIDRLVITAAIDGSGTMSQIQNGFAKLDGSVGAQYLFSGKDFKDERALMIMELYRKDSDWRVMPSGQGFNGGLDALVRHFGGEVASSSSAPAASPVPPVSSLNLEKRLILEKRIEKEAPHLLDLTKKATISLEKVGLQAHRAKVCLVLDISASMSGLYSRGLVQKFAERILALGCRFDDDGEIDIFLFGRDAHQPAPMSIGNNSSYVPKTLNKYPLEYDTQYAKAIAAVREFYFPANQKKTDITSTDMPVYVMFVTDGDTGGKDATEQQIRAASKEPIFWQFMGIGKSNRSKKSKNTSMLGGIFGGGSSTDSTFPFLEKLDELSGRFVDNAGFFSVETPEEHPDNVLYDLLMEEYPQWLKVAKQKGLLR